MLRALYLLIFMLIIWEEHIILTTQSRQEAATIKFFNRKYLSSCSAYTGRRKRGEPYKTNVTFNNVQPWGNNITFSIKYSLGNTEMVLIRTQGCDILKIDWLSNYFGSYSDIPLKCPLNPGVHSIFNMELPPKNLPIIVPKGRFLVKVTAEITSTKEIFVEFHMILNT